MSGLKSEIRQRVHTHRPATRGQAMQLAHDIEVEMEGIEHVGDGFSMG